MHLFKVLPICWMLSWTHCKGFLFIPLNNCMKQVFFMPGFHMRKLKLRQINWFAQHHKKLGKTRWIHIQTQFFFGCEASCGILLPQSGEVSSPNHWTSRELPQTLFWIKITPLQYSCLENLMDGGAWWAAVHGVAKSQTRLSDFGNPLQCSCLENPRDGGAWCAAVYGVAQSRTRLKRLSSSSSSGLYNIIISRNCTYK